MKSYVLTDEQQTFASENHDMVNTFLRAKHLKANAYYDIVVFGYLRAVHKYYARPELHKYGFKSIAWRAMESDLVNHYRKEDRTRKNMPTISLSSAVFKGSNFMVEETVASTERISDKLDLEATWDIIAEHVPAPHVDILRMLSVGYTHREIAKKRRVSADFIEQLVSSLSPMVRELCLA